MKSLSGIPFRVAAVVLSAVLVSPVAAAQEPSPSGVRTIEECIELALSHNVDVKDGETAIDDAKATKSGTTAMMAPKVHVDANAMQWGSKYDINLGATFLIHGPHTWGFSASFIQPLTPLFAVYDQLKVSTLGIDVATLKRDATLRDVAFQAAEAYLELLKAERLESVEATSVHELEANLQQSQSMFDHGVIGKNDLLRADLALAEAKQRLIAARGEVVAEKGGLSTALGLGADSTIEVAPWTREPHPLESDAVEAIEARAVQNRLEVAVLNRALDQAEKAVTIAKLKYVPQVNLVGSYAHVEMGTPVALQETNSVSVGVVGSWDVLDWGVTAAGVAHAKGDRERALTAKTRLEDSIRLEARRAYVAAKSASEALGVARVAVAQAEENFRIVSKRFEAAASTSFDVVDAQSLLTRSRAREQTALYDYLIARAAVQRATGAMRPKAE